MDEQCCRECRFRRFATNECHRHSPLVTGGLHCAVETVWPIITEDNYCGDFEQFIYEPDGSDATVKS